LLSGRLDLEADSESEAALREFIFGLEETSISILLVLFQQ